jgi:Secretion system C-terminal sorting domain
MKKLILLLFIINCSLSIINCTAQPINDNCPGTTLATHNGCIPIAGTIAAATFSGFPASCGGAPNHDVFYNFVATHTTHAVTVTGCANMDAVIHVYSGTCGGTTVACINNTGIGAVETGTLTGLTIGNTYWLKVYDFYGNPSCSTFSICVSLPPPPNFIVAISPTMITCNGTCTGAAIGAYTGGYGPYSYSWSGPSGYTSDSLSISGLCAGMYTLAVTDSFDMSVATSTVVMTQAAPMFNLITSNDTTICPGGTATLNVNFDANSIPANCGLATTGACAGSASSADVGTDTLRNSSYSFPAPFANWYTALNQQYLYTAAELNAAGITAGKIDELSWYVSSIPTNCLHTFNNYTLKMGCTNLATFGTAPVYVPGLTTVFPSQSFTITVGWNTLSFPFGYNWDGVSNLIIEICNTQGPPYPSFTTNAISTYTPTMYVSSQVFQSDQQDQCTSPNGFGSTMAGHPNMRLHYCSAVFNPSTFSYLWSPAIGNIANDTAQYTTGQPSANTSYIVTVTDSTTGCYKTDTVNVTVLCGLAVQQLTMDNNQFTIYPNPATESFTIESTNHKIKSIKVFNTLGEIISTTTPNNTKSIININQYANGIYFIEITDEDGNTVNRKIVKQ